MKVAVLGGGIAGLTAAYSCAKKGHSVTLYEKSSTLGGLARGFSQKHWRWPLEYAYHHIFASDTDIIEFAKETGFEGIFFEVPKTNSLYSNGDKYRIIPVDSPKSFLQFPLLTMPEKVRAAFFLAILKFLPMLPLYEKLTAEKFVKVFMGERMWNIFFQELFRKKFGKYSGNILASFLWARINKRTQSLGYMKGGFQAFVDHLEAECIKMGVNIHAGTEISTLKRGKKGFTVNKERYDSVISTLPSSVFAHVAGSLLTEKEGASLTKLSYLHARVLILETDKPILKSSYWLNICTPKVPTMIVAQHTHFVDKKYYGGRHIAYVGWYKEKDDPIMKESKSELIRMLEPHLRSIEGSSFKILHSYSFVGPFAQPIFDTTLLKHKPTFTTSVPGLYVANLDMTYPYDRGTNYAVQLGKKVSEMI